MDYVKRLTEVLMFDDKRYIGLRCALCSQAASEHTTSFAVRNADADHAISVLREEFAAELAAIDNLSSEIAQLHSFGK